MPKTPDEIKKAMEYCVGPYCPGEKCPYWKAESCAQDKTYDALALIQQLEADKKRTMENAEILSAAVRRLEAERDAAVDGLKSNCTCPECKYFSDDIQDPCRGCKPTDSKFEWRGVQKEE